MEDLPAPRSIQISGSTIRLFEPLKNSLFIECSVDGTNADSILLEKGQQHEVTRSFQKPITLHDGSILTVHTEEKHPTSSNKTLARVDLCLENLWSGQDQGVPGGQTKRYQIHIKDWRIQLWLNLVELPSMTPLNKSGLGPSSSAAEGLQCETGQSSQSLRAVVLDAVQILADFKTTLGRLNGKHIVASGTKYADIIHELRPMAKAIFGCVNTIYGQVKTQDHHILMLAERMESTVNLIKPVKNITELNVLRKTLQKFPGLMEETADLIETWIQQRALVNSIQTPLDHDKVEELKERYTNFQQELVEGIQADTGVQSLVDSGKLDALLGGIKMVGPKANPCIPGTRATILADVEAKTDDHEGPNAIWIRGAPGSGKSAISLSAKARLHKQGQLVTYFRFDRNDSAATTPTALWRRVAHDLAHKLPSVRTRVLQGLGGVDFSSAKDVFNSLVKEPLCESIEPPVDRPLVIVIDALDECASSDSRDLLETLKRWVELPKHFKLLVTSREDGKIKNALSPIATSIYIPSGSDLIDNPRASTSIEASKDIRTFLEARFSEIRAELCEDEDSPEIAQDWPGSEKVGGMVDRAAGNFMWATAAVKFIDIAVDKDEHLKKIMANKPLLSGMEALYSLYSTILQTAFANDDPRLTTLRIVLGIMVCAKRSLSDDEYTKLPSQTLMTPISYSVLLSIRRGLRSIIVTGGNLRFVHKSFDDFLLSKQCPPEYAISIEECHHRLTDLCLETMKNGLRFNICNLKTSCLKNQDIPDIDIKVANGISTLLSYSCCFWADHLTQTWFDGLLMNEAREIILDKLLYWFEAMSLLKEIDRVSHSLLLLLKWSHPSPDDEFKEFVRDAQRFIAAFIYPIAQSAPHIYISALPFAPQCSAVARRFRSRFPHTLSLSMGTLDWPPNLFVSELHSERVNSVAFSPNEAYFASGSNDRTICICDSNTGNLVSGPFRDYSEARLVFFDSDGRRVWVSNSADRVVGWDVETGDKILDFQAPGAIGCCRLNADQTIISMSGETVTLWSTDTGRRLCDLPIDSGRADRPVILSPSGGYIACAGPDDYTIVRIWQLVEGSEIRLVQGPSPEQPQFKHTADIFSLSFSVDGSFVVSGSRDATILIWDAKTGDTVGPPLDTKVGWVDAVAYSHASGLLLSVHTIFYTLRVWNAFTQEAVFGPLHGHTRRISAIALSRDGRRALTASNDCTVRMWDLSRTVGGPVMEFDDFGDGIVEAMTVECFAFSPCGELLASLTSTRASYRLDDVIVRAWNVNTGERILGPHPISDDYSQIIFSPDGSQVVAHSSNEVTAWNVKTRLCAYHQDLGKEEDSDDDSAEELNNDVENFVEHVAFNSHSADQRSRMVTCSNEGTVRIWTLNNDDPWTEDLPASGPQPVDASAPVRILALSPDGSTTIVRDDNRDPRNYIWSTTTYQPLPHCIFTDNGQYQVAYSPSGQFLVTASDESPSMLRIWNIQTGKLIAGPSPVNTKIRCLAFSPDDSHIAFSCSAYSPLFSDFSDSSDFYDSSDSPNSSNSDSDSTAIWIWDGRTGKITSGPWNGHIGAVTALAFSPDGEKLGSSSKDGWIRIWNTADLFRDSLVPDGFMYPESDMDFEDGWVMERNGKLRFWVPVDQRDKLVWNGNISLMGDDWATGIIKTTHVDLTRFRFGENWMECFGGER